MIGRGRAARDNSGTTAGQRGTQRQFDLFGISVPLRRATKAQAIVCKQYRPNPLITETAETSHFSCTRQFAPSEPCGAELQKAGFARCVPHNDSHCALHVASCTAIHTTHFALRPAQRFTRCAARRIPWRSASADPNGIITPRRRPHHDKRCMRQSRQTRMTDVPQLSHATFTRQHNLSRTHPHTTALAAYSANPSRRKSMNASAAGVCMMLRFHATTDLASRCGDSGRNRNPSPTCPTS